jgi:hypothetical protein
MASPSIFGSRPVTLAAMVPVGLARRHSRRCPLRRSSRSSSTFLRPLAPGPLQTLRGSYGRCDSCPPDSMTLKLSVCSTCGQVSLVHALDLPTILSPTTCAGSALPGHVTHRKVEPRALLHGPTPNENSGLRHYTAGSPPHAGRIEFLLVRTGRSPPVASHPVSRRRSYLRLQVYVEPGGDFHPSSRVRYIRRTVRRLDATLAIHREL